MGVQKFKLLTPKIHGQSKFSKGSETFRDIFPQKWKEFDRALNLHLNVLALCEDTLLPLSCLVTRTMRRESQFGKGIVWGTILSGFPVFWVAVPGCSRNGYGTSPNLWVQKKLVKFWQSTLDTRLCPTEFFWEFFSYSLLDLFRNLGDVVLSQFRVKRVLFSTVPSTFRRFSRNCR